jgi:pectin methylesterase-like acyl-CoA thioesterase
MPVVSSTLRLVTAYVALPLVGMFLLIGVASAATYNVPAQYKTIQKAINVAHDGDTIKVASGTYKEYLDINGKQLTLIGSKFPKIYGIKIEQSGQGKIYNFAITKNGIDITDSAGNIIRNCALTNGDRFRCKNIINGIY